MKGLITALALLFCVGLIAQPSSGGEVISEAETLTQLNDTTWLLTYVLVEDNGTTFPDSTIKRTELDSTGVIDYKFVENANQSITMDALLGRAFFYRTGQALYNQRRQDLEDFTGGDVDYFDRATAQWGNQLRGRYRVIGDTNSVAVNFTATLDFNGPGTRLRLIGEASEGTWNVLVSSDKGFQVNGFFDGNQRFVWDWDSRERPVYRDIRFVIPSNFLTDYNGWRIIRIGDIE